MNLKVMLVSLCAILAIPFANANEGAKPAAAVEEPKPWLEVQAMVSGLKTKRQQLMQSFTSTAHSKEHMKPNSAEFKAANAELVKIHKELKTVTEDYNKQLIILKYRFPERLAKQDKRSYETFEVPELKELEAQVDLDSRLTQSLKAARGQFGRPAPAAADGRAPSSVAPLLPVADEIKTLREEDAPLFRK